MTSTVRETEAQRLGTEHGTNAGSWAVDGNSTPETARAILRGIEDGDPEVLDSLPIVPDLSGEWADLLSGPDVYALITGDEVQEEESSDDFTELLDVYEAAYQDAALAEIIRSARAIA